jgi:NAD(P)-dependent dehydrogenase (short-subunit alcohol dehydrogenase family)
MTEPHVFRGRLEGKVAIVTGAGSQGDGDGIGTGKAIATLFAGEGARVCLVDLNVERANQTLRRIEALGGEAFVVAADVTQDADCGRVVAETVERYGRLDILVNNVGISGAEKFFADFDEAAWERIFAVNLKSAILMSRHSVLAMIPNGGGSIVNITSIAGDVAHGMFGYGPSKAAMKQLAREIAVTYGRNGIRANSIAPGHVHTPHVERFGFTPAVREARRKIAPLGIEGDGWDVAYTALFLAGDEARFVSGQHLAVDGGLTITGPMIAHRLVSQPDA